MLAAVHSDWIEYIALPSPEKQHTGVGACAIATPIEAGKPQPIPPDASA